MLAFVFLQTHVFSQDLVNKNWEKSYGSVADTIRWGNTGDIDTLGNIIVAGNNISGSYSRIMVTKLDSAGDTLWKRFYSSSSLTNEFAVQVKVSPDGYINVIGATYNNPTKYDIVLLRYDMAGNRHFAVTYDGQSQNDYPTGIAFSASGDIFVCGSSTNSSGNEDYVTLKYNSTGALQWVQRYDAGGGRDFATGLVICNSNGSVYVTGRSIYQSSPMEATTMQYDMTSGSVENSVNEIISSANNSLPVGIVMNSVGKIIITYASKGSSDYDIKTVCYNSDLTHDWIRTWDGGGYDEVRGIIAATDSCTLIASTAWNNSGGADYVVTKYDSGGNVRWQRRFAYGNPGDWWAEPIAIKLNSKNAVYITGTLANAEQSFISTVKIEKDGSNGWEKVWRPNNTFAQANDIILSGSNFVYVTGAFATSSSPHSPECRIAQYDNYDRPMVRRDSTDTATFAPHQLLVKFQSGVINSGIQTNPEIEYGKPSAFIRSSVKDTIETALGVSLSNNILVKVIPWLTPNDTVSYGRDSQLVKVPDFWNLAVMYLPVSMNEASARNSLKSITSIFQEVSLNHISHNDIGANDGRYSTQASLHDANGFSNSSSVHININIEPAWDINTGNSTLKVGIMEGSAIWYKHQDYHMTQNDQSYSGSKVHGYSYEENTTAGNVDFTQVDYSHATSTSGIIGAIRDNDYTSNGVGAGVAGIAGGDWENSKSGVQVYELDYAGESENIRAVFEAAWDGSSTNPNPNIVKNGYALDLINQSAGQDDDPSASFYEAYNYAYSSLVPIIASRGNDASISTLKHYPAIFPNTDWVISVGASGQLGKLWTTSTPSSEASRYGTHMDVLAPGDASMVFTLNHDVYTGTKPFIATSAAAPHVSGIAALMLSQTLSRGNDKLSPEDVQNVIDETAFDTYFSTDADYPVGYDEHSGWGEADAGNALTKVVDPNYKITHYTTDNNTTWNTSVISTNKQIHLDKDLTIGSTTIKAGDYIIELDKLTATVAFTIPTGYTYYNAWPRGSRSNLLCNPDNTNGDVIQNTWYAVNEGVNSAGGSFSGYVIEFKNKVGSSTSINLWYPFAPTSSSKKIAYTVHSASTTLGIQNPLIKEALRISPNPASDQVLTSLTVSSRTNLSYEIYDLNGKMVKTVAGGEQEAGSYQKIIDISDLQPGTYILTCITSNGVCHSKFVKL
jgi:hypothetical protein